MAAFDINMVISELSKLQADGPAVLASLSTLLANAQTNAAPLNAFITKFFPNIDPTKLEATAVADLKVAVDFLSNYGPQVLTGLLGALTLLSKFFPAAA
jgi:hypothetical protein